MRPGGWLSKRKEVTTMSDGRCVAASSAAMPATPRYREAPHIDRPVRAALAAAGGLLVLALSVTAVLAHEQREVAGYSFVVGLVGEPVFTGQKSGLEFQVTQDEEPVEGLEETLEAEVIHQDQRRGLPLSPRFGEPGWYESIFFPTAAGPYTFHIFGEIAGQPIDESFTSGPETFSEVEEQAGGQFPLQLPPQTEVADAAQRGADAAGQATIALVLGAAGLVVGIAALGLALAARPREG
jgi:hypothetical protein